MDCRAVLTRRCAGELLRERLCLGRFRGGEYCLPRNALFPLLRLRLGLQLLDCFLLYECRLLSARSLLPLSFLSLLLDLLLSAWFLLLSFPWPASSCLAGDRLLAAALRLSGIAEICRVVLSGHDRRALSHARRPLPTAVLWTVPKIVL